MALSSFAPFFHCRTQKLQVPPQIEKLPPKYFWLRSWLRQTFVRSSPLKKYLSPTAMETNTIQSCHALQLSNAMPFWFRLMRLRTGVGLFRSTIHKFNLMLSGNCSQWRSRAEEQTANHILASCTVPYTTP